MMLQKSDPSKNNESQAKINKQATQIKKSLSPKQSKMAKKTKKQPSPHNKVTHVLIDDLLGAANSVTLENADGFQSRLLIRPISHPRV